MVFIHVLKVLNSKVAEEMDIVENHLSSLTSMYYFLQNSGRKLQKMTATLIHDHSVL